MSHFSNLICFWAWRTGRLKGLSMVLAQMRIKFDPKV